MDKLVRALLVTSTATVAAYLVIAVAKKTGDRKDRPTVATQLDNEIDSDHLPAEVRDALVAELDGLV